MRKQALQIFFQNIKFLIVFSKYIIGKQALLKFLKMLIVKWSILTFFFFFIENSFLNLHTTDISFKEPYNSKWKCVTFFSQWKCNPFPISLHDQLYNFALSLELLRRESCLTVFYQMFYSAVVFTNMKPGSILMQVDLIKHTLADRWNKNT